MSKSAIKSLTKAQEIIAAAGVNIDLVSFINDADLRKNWRNADALATLIINSAANAFQCENSETFADNCFDNMQEAVQRYIDANLESWNGKEWTTKDAAPELARLQGMVDANMNFEAGVSAAAVKLAYAKHIDEAIILDRDFVENNARYNDFWAANDFAARAAIVDEAHDYALVMDEEITTLAQTLADRRCYWMNAETIVMRQQDVIQQYKRAAFDKGPRVAQHIIKVITIARRKALALKGHLESKPIPLTTCDLLDGTAEIPF